MNNLFALDWGVSSVRTTDNSTLLRFVPHQYRETMKSYVVPDVALQAVRKFASIPDNVAATRHFDNVRLGSYRIPVWEDGFAYVRTSVGPRFNAPIYAFVEGLHDSLKYSGQWIGGKEMPVTDSTWAKLSGKIVVIDWPYMTVAAKRQWLGYGRIYAQLISAILTNAFVHRYNQWDLAIVFLIILLAGALVFSVRTPLAVIIMIILHGIFLYGAIRIFVSYDILYDPTYVLFSLLLCTLVLPVAKVSHERGYYKKQYEMSEESVALLEKKLNEQEKKNRKT